jgi:putative phosphoribosyl transferase
MRGFVIHTFFEDRADAGRQLARKLQAYAQRPEVLVLGLPRGGVPVAFEVAGALGAPLDVFLVRKLGVPGREELAMGAIASGGVRVLNEDVIAALHISAATLTAVTAAEEDTLSRRERFYRGDQPRLEARDRIIVLVDDGLATGASMCAALQALALQAPRRLIAAVPVAAPDACERLRPQSDEVVCASLPADFQGVSEWYRDFSQTSDEEVKELLQRGASRASGRREQGRRDRGS